MTADGYCQVTDVQRITSLTNSDIADADLEGIIESVSTPQVNHDISVFVYKEDVVNINTSKQNKINGTNTTFYTQAFPLCDMDNDGDIDTSDILVYSVASDGTETALGVSSVVGDTGKFVLSSAPSAVQLKVTYRYMKNRDMLSDTVHPLIVLACAQLSAAYAFLKLDATQAGKLVRFQVDRFSATLQPPFDKFMSDYRKTITKIISDAGAKASGTTI